MSQTDSIFKTAVGDVIIQANGDLSSALKKADESLKTNDVTIELGSGTYFVNEKFVIRNDTGHRLTIRGNKDTHVSTN